jgi:hypothetical protein
MGSIGNCCCCPIDFTDLPNWTIPGYTAGTWGGEPGVACCFNRVYTVNPSAFFQETFTDVLARTYIKETGRIEVKAISTRTRYATYCCNFSNPNAVVECDQDEGTAYYVDFENINEIKWRGRMRYRLESISIRIGAHRSDCEDGALVYTVSAKLSWRILLNYQQYIYQKRARDVTVVHPCMTQVLSDSNSETISDWSFGNFTTYLDTTIESNWVQQFEELPESFDIDFYNSPVTPSFYDSCIELVSDCYANRRPSTPQCFPKFYLADELEIPLLELEERERCEPLGYSECCYPWNQLVRQEGYDGAFGISPLYPNSNGTGFGVVFIVPVILTAACCVPTCPPSPANFTGNEKAIRFGQHSMVSYEIESEVSETPEDEAVDICVPETIISVSI